METETANLCKCGLPLRKITVATLPGSFDTKFVEIDVCDNWLDPYHDERYKQDGLSDDVADWRINQKHQTPL